MEKQRQATARQGLLARALLWPSALGVALFYVLPFFVVVYYSLVDSAFSKNFVFLENYRELLQNAAFRLAVKNTAVFSAAAVPPSVVLSLLLAVALENRMPWKSQLRSVFLSPIMVPVASVALIWQVLFHQSGAFNGLLESFGIAGADWLRSAWAPFVVVLLFLWKNLGYNMVLFMAALSSIPRDVLEAANIDGAGGLRRFWYIKLRYLSPTLLFVTILSIANSFKVFREVYILAGNYPTEELYMLQHFMNNMFRTLNYPRMSAATVLMVTVLGGVLAVLFWVEGRFGKDVEE